MKTKTSDWLIREDHKQYASQVLDKFYQNSFVPAEKKTYLSQLRKSLGPYLGIESKANKTGYILDAASQIATLGLGFNPLPFFGTTRHPQSWLDHLETRDFQKLKSSYLDFFKRELSTQNLFFCPAHSGAEANEIALGDAYLHRSDKKQKKVLAFEGSFHGRMLIALSSTWNKQKRKDFEWPGHHTVFTPYPELKDGNIYREIPKNWNSYWDQLSADQEESFPKDWEKNVEKDHELKLEWSCLFKVFRELQKNQLFAIMIEPMQCEGGDRYSSDRFHAGLCLLAKRFKVALIYDEVQTGFHLGRDFFWHQSFRLGSYKGVELSPDYIICAKKAQTGLVLSSREIKRVKDEYSKASLIRGYIHAQSLTQNSHKILELEKLVTTKSKELCQKYATFFHSPRSFGMAFSIDLFQADHLKSFVTKRFDFGLLFYPAGSHTLRFRVNTAYKKEDILYLFEALDTMASAIFLGEEPSMIKSVPARNSKKLDLLYQIHQTLFAHQIKNANFQEKMDFYCTFFKDNFDYSLVHIDDSNFKRYKDDIESIQLRTYEKQRQTPISKFEQTTQEKNSLSLGLTNKKSELIAISISAQMALYPYENGLRELDSFKDPAHFYMLDTTVLSDFKGQALGLFLRYALFDLASSMGVSTIWGRNRDHLAKAMYDINLSLGASLETVIKEDYKDEEEFRDVLIYSQKTSLDLDQKSLRGGLYSDFSKKHLKSPFIKKSMPYLINKICLSNFIGNDFMKSMKSISALFPKPLRHHYSTSGQSECVDKIVKSLWVKHKNSKKMLSFKNHFFGDGSFLARSLYHESPRFFQTTFLDDPIQENYKKVLRALKKKLKENSYIGIFIEPRKQLDLQKVPKDFLKELLIIAKRHKTPVIFNETASSFSRFSNNFFASSPSLCPDALMCYTGGQAAVVGMKKDFFIKEPLKLISTWDGDEFSLMKYAQSVESFKSKDAKKLRSTFQKKLIKELKAYDIHDYQLEDAMGIIKGHLPLCLSQYFIKRDNFFLCCPNLSEIEDFLKEHGYD